LRGEIVNTDIELITPVIALADSNARRKAKGCLARNLDLH